MRKVSKFQSARNGSPVYTCRVCQHVTRETGEGEESCGLCAACFELAGLENTQSDCGAADPYLVACAPSILARIAEVEKRGRGDGGWRAIFAKLLAAA